MNAARNAKGSIRLAILLAALLFSVQGTAQEIPRFDIRAFRVEGNKLLSRQEVDAVLAPFIGSQKDFGDVQRALEALEQVYKDRGYNTVSVLLPEQALEGGEVLLQVIEGHIRSVRIEGQKHFDAANIRASLPALKEGEVPVMPNLSASLRVANEHPMKKLSIRLAPGEKEDELDAIVAVTDEKPWRVGVTLDNTGTAQTGRHRLGLIWQHGNLFDRDHQLSLQYQTSPQKTDEVKVYAASYRVPLYARGDSVDVFATRSDVDVGSIATGLGPLAVTGKGSTFGARYNWNLQRREDYEHQLVFGIDQKTFKNSCLILGQQICSDVSVRPLSLAYNGRWAGPGSETGFFVSLARNLPGGSNGDQAAFDQVRPGAPDDFEVLRGGVNLSRAFAADWQWRVNLSGQWTRSPLVPGEQFGVGGNATVRGFEERELSNDEGFLGNLEVYTPELCAALRANCRLVGFYDFGALSRNQALPGESASDHVAGAGVGVRFVYGKHLTVQADYAQVVDPGADIPSGAWKLHARIGLIF